MNLRGFVVRLAIVTILAAAWCAACDPGPPEVSAEVQALEQYLLSADEIGGGFTRQESGAVRGTGVGHLCSDTDVSLSEFAAMHARFTNPSGDNEVSVEHYLWTAESQTLDALMLDLETALVDCDGAEWDYFGEEIRLDVIEIPPVGDDWVAVHQSGPTTDDVLETQSAYVRSGEVLVIVRVEESRYSADAPQVVDQTEFEDLVATAVGKLPKS